MSADSTDRSPDRPTEQISVAVNGEVVEAEVEPRLKLGDFLRREGYRGVRIGCEHGVCGACCVLLDGDVVKSCLLYAVQADGREVTTVEGLADDGDLHPVQEAFHEEHALQCGFCTSGFVMSSLELLDRNPDPSREEIRAGLADNVCRCTGYQNIIDGVERAADGLDGPPEYPGGANAVSASDCASGDSREREGSEHRGDGGDSPGAGSSPGEGPGRPGGGR